MPVAATACLLANLIAQGAAAQSLKAIVRDFAQQHHLPGVAAGVWRRGEIILRIGVGNQAGPGSRPVDGETVFHLASVTKPFVATAVMQLVADGNLARVLVILGEAKLMVAFTQLL